MPTAPAFLKVGALICQKTIEPTSQSFPAIDRASKLPNSQSELKLPALLRFVLKFMQNNNWQFQWWTLQIQRVFGHVYQLWRTFSLRPSLQLFSFFCLRTNILLLLHPITCDSTGTAKNSVQSPVDKHHHHGNSDTAYAIIASHISCITATPEKRLNVF